MQGCQLTANKVPVIPLPSYYYKTTKSTLNNCDKRLQHKQLFLFLKMCVGQFKT